MGFLPFDLQTNAMLTCQAYPLTLGGISLMVRRIRVCSQGVKVNGEIFRDLSVFVLSDTTFNIYPPDQILAFSSWEHLLYSYANLYTIPLNGEKIKDISEQKKIRMFCWQNIGRIIDSHSNS